jgi:hypothetical protein
MAKGKKGKGDNKKNIDDNAKNIDEMTEKDFIIETLYMITSAGTTYEQRRKVYEYTLKVLSEPKKPEPNDTGGA